ncbi:MAG: hypothetical protein ABFS86_08835 [Planctomycetota bacterium]
MKRLALPLALLVLAACPSGSRGPAHGKNLVDPVENWTEKADADWADDASSEVIRLGRLTADNVLDLTPQKAEGVCRILAHLDHPGARALLLDLVSHPDGKSGFYRPFVIAAAAISWARAIQTGQVESLAPLTERLVKDAEGMADFRWFDSLASTVEATTARDVLPALREAAARLGKESEKVSSILSRRVIQVHHRLNDPGAVALAKEILEGKPRFESGDALRYLDRQDPEAGLAFAEKILPGTGATTAALMVIHRHGGPRTEELTARAEELMAGLPRANRLLLTWFGRPPSWEPPRELREDPAVARFLVRNGIGNRMKYLRLWIQPVLTRTQARWFADEASSLAQRAELAALFSEPIPHFWDGKGVPDPYGVWEDRLSQWWETRGYRLTYDKAENRYTPEK